MHLKRDTHSCFIDNFNPIFSKVLQENIDSKCVSNYRKAVVCMTVFFCKYQDVNLEALEQALSEIIKSELNCGRSNSEIDIFFTCSW